MRNRNKPFFYDKKRNPWSSAVAIPLVIAVMLIWGYRVPTIRQVCAWRFFGAANYLKSYFVPALSEENSASTKPPVPYPTVELPEASVLFAKSITDIHAKDDDGTMIESISVELTPEAETPQGVQWFIETSQDKTALSDIAKEPIFLTFPVFERQDYQNDGPAILSAALRYYKKNESQYLIRQSIQPDPFDPTVDFSELQTYARTVSPDLPSVVRVNGDIAILTASLSAGFPVILRISVAQKISEWRGDDRLIGRYILALGFDPTSRTIYFQDPFEGDRQFLSFEDLLKAWYPFQREYMIIYPIDEEETIKDILQDQWSIDQNYQSAAEKFQTDVAMLPRDADTWINYANILSRLGADDESWEAFQSAIKMKPAQRTLFYNTVIFRSIFNLGYADELIHLTDKCIKMKSRSEDFWLWKGWAYVLKKEPKTAMELFRKAEKINPSKEDILYALAFIN